MSEESIDDSFSDRELLEAFRRRVEKSAEWLEHERWHEENEEERGRAEIVTISDDEEVSKLEQKEEVFVDAPRKKTPLWAGCTCQSPSVKLVLGDDGEVRNELPVAIDTNAYGVNQTTLSTYSSPAGSSVEYKPSESSSKGLYK